jgi:hypothetical protein
MIGIIEGLPHLRASLVNDSCLDSGTTHPIGEHEPCWARANDEDVNICRYCCWFHFESDAH